ARQVLTNILPETKGIAVSLGLPVLYRNGLYNAACLAVDGRIAGFAVKRHLAGEGLHYEPRWFKAWPENVVAELYIGGMAMTIGDINFEVGPVKMGFEICEDARTARSKFPASQPRSRF
ncbi:MAG: NAD+ synthetase, partial [Planctomycetota bacterium]|nr:NAD+ synthetase [Planctomycetota bacterium]